MKSVNLFREDVNHSQTLLTLFGRSELATCVAILYQSNVQQLVPRRNLEAPTGVLAGNTVWLNFCSVGSTWGCRWLPSVAMTSCRSTASNTWAASLNAPREVRRMPKHGSLASVEACGKARRLVAVGLKKYSNRKVVDWSSYRLRLPARLRWVGRADRHGADLASGSIGSLATAWRRDAGTGGCHWEGAARTFSSQEISKIIPVSVALWNHNRAEQYCLAGASGL